MLIGLIFGPSVYPLECLRGYEQRSEPNAKWSFSCIDGNCSGERPNEMVDELPNEISCSFERNFRSRERIADNKSFSLERIPVRRPTVHKRDVKYFVVQAHIFCRTDFNFCRNDFCFLSYRPNGILSYRRSGGFWGICRTGSDILSHRLIYFVGRSARPIALPYHCFGHAAEPRRSLCLICFQDIGRVWLISSYLSRSRSRLVEPLLSF